jgi:uncharacterized protein YqeY
MTVEKLTQDMYTAMKAKDKFKKDTLSAIIGAIQKTAIDRKCKDNITEALVDEVLLKELKTVKEMIDTCPADRDETRAEYTARYNIVASYAPEQLTEEDIALELVMFCNLEGIDLAKENKAQIMRGFMPTIKGRADGKLANKVIMEALK